jgi:flagellar motor switch protein FliN
LLREAANSAAGDLYAKEGKKCQITIFEEVACERQITNSFQLRAGDRSWTILVRDEVRAVAAPPPAPSKTQPKAEAKPAAAPPPPAESKDSLPGQISPGFELLLDVELEASLRFGSREMPLGEILELGPGDVVELDRHITDPVDLIVGDKIVARGEVVLVNGNFGLKVSEVAEPKKRLESIRCLF